MEALNKIDEFFKRYYLDRLFKLCCVCGFLYGHYTRDIFDLVFWGILILFCRIDDLSDCIYSALYEEGENGD